MTEEFELHRYCDGIDCSWCGIPEPCIYRIANRLQTQLKEKETENKKYKETLNDIKEVVEKVYNDCDDCYRDTDTNCDVDCIDCSLGAQANLAEQILQKISEIENNE